MKVNGFTCLSMLKIVENYKYEERNPAIALQYSFLCQTLKDYLVKLEDLLSNSPVGVKFVEYKQKVQTLIYKFSIKNEGIPTKPSILDNNGDVCIEDPTNFRAACVSLYNEYLPYIKEYVDKYEDFMSHFTDLDLDIKSITNKELLRKLVMCNRKDTPYKLSNASKQSLMSCHKPLIDVFSEVLYYKDISILEGYRGKEEQEKAKKNGTSKASFGYSAHNYNPSLAIDVVPYPIPKKVVNGKEVWDNDSPEWDELHDIVSNICLQFGVKLKWGGDFQTLVDKPHYEIEDWKSLVNLNEEKYG